MMDWMWKVMECGWALDLGPEQMGGCVVTYWDEKWRTEHANFGDGCLEITIIKKAVRDTSVEHTEHVWTGGTHVEVTCTQIFRSHWNGCGHLVLIGKKVQLLIWRHSNIWNWVKQRSWQKEIGENEGGITKLRGGCANWLILLRLNKENSDPELGNMER